MNCRRCNTPDVPLREIDFNGRRIFQDYACVKCFAILEQNFRQSWSVFKGLLDMGVSEPSASDMVKHYINSRQGCRELMEKLWLRYKDHVWGSPRRRTTFKWGAVQFVWVMVCALLGVFIPKVTGSLVLGFVVLLPLVFLSSVLVKGLLWRTEEE